MPGMGRFRAECWCGRVLRRGGYNSAWRPKSPVCGSRGMEQYVRQEAQSKRKTDSCGELWLVARRPETLETSHLCVASLVYGLRVGVRVP
jgi:hypothetical protein